MFGWDGQTLLSLAICKGIVDEHGGEIGVISAADEGATFWFKLPIEAKAAVGNEALET